MNIQKTLATFGLWAIPVSVISGGMYGDWQAGMAVGLCFAASALLALITYDIWRPL